MRSFMSKALSGGAECSDCSSAPLRSAGQEDSRPGEPAVSSTEVGDPKNAAPSQPITTEKTTVILKGPLGEVMTKALQMSYKKPNVAIDRVGTESITTYVQANGMVYGNKGESTTTVHSTREVVGVIPATSEEPTCLNALLEAARSVKDIEFIFVGEEPTTSNSSSPSSRWCFVPGIDGNPAIESVQVIVNYKKS